MKKIFTTRKTFFVALFLMCGFGLKAQNNLLSNFSFENWTDGKPNEWTLKVSAPSTGTEETAIVLDGAKSLKIIADAASKTIKVNQSVSITPGKEYTLNMSYYIESGDGSDARIWCNFMKGGKNFSSPELKNTKYKELLQGPDNKYFPDERGTWKTYTIDFTAPADADGFHFEFRQYKGSTVYWDKMSLVEKAAAPAPVLSVKPTSMDFSATVNTSSDPQNVSVTGANLTVSPTYSLSGADASMFSATGDLTTDGGEISVTFSPTSTGTKTAILTVTSGDISKTVDLQGTATSSDNPYGLDDSAPLNELNQDFEAMMENEEPSENWVTFAEQGDRQWVIKAYGGTQYAQMGAYRGTGKYQTLLISPAINFDAIDKTKVSFDWKAGHANGATLKVYVMTKGGTKKEVKTINATEPANGYAEQFTTETMDLSAHSGVKFLVFEYNGDVDVPNTTTYQIDNVIISSSAGIHDISAKIRIFASDNQLYIDNDGSAKTIEVYNVLGRKLVHKVATSGLNVVPVQKGQLLIVKAGRKVAKVIVK